MYERFVGSFPKLSASNSFVVDDDFIIYFKTDKGVRTYWDYHTGFKLGVSVVDISDEKNKIKIGLTHEEFVEFLETNIRTEIGKTSIKN